jgi:hypothetical protein
MKIRLLMLIIAVFAFSAVNAQTPDPVGAANEIWLDVTYPGVQEAGKIPPDSNFSLDFWFANDNALGANTNGFLMWSPDGVTWSYRTDAAWFGSDPLSRGVTDKHVSISGRWDGAYDGTITPILVPNPLLGGSSGTDADSMMVGGVAVFAPGLPAGPLANLVQLNMTMGPNMGTWCVDTVTQFPPAGTWIFSLLDGSSTEPAFAGTFCWDVAVPSAVGSDEPNVPAQYGLDQNYPNPFNPTTRIAFGVAKRGNVSIVVYNVLGQQITNLVDKVYEPGNYEVEWNGTDASGNQVSTGIYFYRMEVNDFVKTRSMLMIK